MHAVIYFYGCLEFQHVWRVQNQVGHLLRSKACRGEAGAEIADYTMRAVCISLRIANVFDGRVIVAQVRCDVCKRSSLEAAAPVPGRNYDRIGQRGNVECKVSMGDCFSISGHRVRSTIENRGLGEILGVFGPVPIWLMALVAAFFPESLLVQPGIVTMPGKELALAPTFLVSSISHKLGAVFLHFCVCKVFGQYV